jgi:hypothetical protein
MLIPTVTPEAKIARGQAVVSLTFMRIQTYL